MIVIKKQKIYFLEYEALVRVECAGVNCTDLLMLKGKYHQQPKLPFTPG